MTELTKYEEHMAARVRVAKFMAMWLASRRRDSDWDVVAAIYAGGELTKLRLSDLDTLLCRDWMTENNA